MTGKAVDNEAELYGRLWEDWAARWIKDKEEKTGNLHKEQSYIYRMFRENKEKQAALLALKPEELLLQYNSKKISDKYVLLKAAHEAFFEYGLIKESDYTGILCEVSTDGKSIPKKLEKKLKEGAGAGELHAEYEKRLSALLRGCITDAFRNRGYHINLTDALNGEGREKREVRPAFNEGSAGTYDPIAKLGSFMAMAHKAPENASSVETNTDRKVREAGGTELFSDDFVRRSMLTYRSLVKSGDRAKAVFVPLHIDTKSGAGLYVVGRTLLKNVRGDRPCYPVVMWFSDLYGEEEGPGPEESGDSAFSLWMGMRRYNELVDALSVYRRIVDSDTVYEGYMGVNGLLPGKIDPYYDSFFDRVPEAAVAGHDEATAREKEVIEAYAKQEEAAKAQMEKRSIRKK